MNNWKYKCEDFTDEMVADNIGFVYCITNIKTFRKYIGKKTFWFTTKKKVKGRSRRNKRPSDWQKYFGSNQELLKDVEKYGAENFRRDILHLCKTKSECSYLELKEQMERRVLERPEYYNEWIMVKIRKRKIFENKSEDF